MMQNIETALMDPEEQQMVQAILQFIPEIDRQAISPDNVLFVLDAMDDYLESKGLLQYDEKTGEATYLDGDVDETEQLQYVLAEAQKMCMDLTAVQIQLIMDGEREYGIEQGYYEDID